MRMLPSKDLREAQWRLVMIGGKLLIGFFWRSKIETVGTEAVRPPKAGEYA
jgi:hypothetical protein